MRTEAHACLGEHRRDGWVPLVLPQVPTPKVLGICLGIANAEARVIEAPDRQHPFSDIRLKNSARQQVNNNFFSATISCEMTHCSPEYSSFLHLWSSLSTSVDEPG